MSTAHIKEIKELDSGLHRITYSGMVSHILLVAGIVLSVAFRLMIRGFSWFPGGRGRALRNWQWLLQQVAEQRNGTIANGSLHRISCLLPNGEIQARIHGSHSHVKIQIRRPLPFDASFYRAPRLLYAFLEAFLKPDLRFEHLPYIVVPASSTGNLACLKQSPALIALLERFSAFGFSVHVDEAGLTLSRRVRNNRLEDLPYLQILTAAENFAELCAEPPAKIPVHEVLSQPNCAYCKESILDGTPVTFCSLCKTPHHRECFDLNGGCSVFGCLSRQQVAEPAAIRI